MRAMWREKQRPSGIKRQPRRLGFDRGALIDFSAREIMWIDDDCGFGLARPNLVRDAAHKSEFTLVISRAALGASANIVIAGFNHHSVGVRIKIESHFAGVLEHELLRGRLART